MNPFTPHAARLLFFLFPMLACISLPASSQLANPETETSDPDIPPFARGIDKAEYLRRRGEHIEVLRGLPYQTSYDPRVKAILEMQQQRITNRQSINATAWTSIGPAPIPNGQTESVSTAVSGRTTAIAIHPTNPNIVYVGTAQGGVYRTLDGGTTWTAIFDNALSLAVGAIAIAPSSTTTVYVGTGEPQLSCDSFFGVGVYRITNAESGSPTLSGPFNSDGVSDVMTGAAIGNIAVHPTDANTIFATTTYGIGGIGCEFGALPARGLFRSTNALGTCTFTKMTTVLNSYAHVDVAMDPNNPNRVLCTVYDNGSPGGVYLSTDAMAVTPTFTRTLILADVRSELALYSSGGVVTAYVASGEANGRLRKSTDGGATWSLALTAANGYCGGNCFYDIAIAVDPTNASNVMLGGSVTGGSTKLIAKSTNGGTTFTNVATGVHGDNQVVRYAPSNSSILYMGTDGGIYKSTDGGTTWSSLSNTGFNATQFQSLALHPTNALFTIGGTQDNGTEWRKPDGSWTRADFGDGGYSLIDQNAADDINVTMYHTYFNLTNDMGYARVTTTLNASDTLWTLYGCGVGGTPNGMTCAATSILFYAPMARGPGNPNTVYFGSDVLYRSSNAGVTMTKVSQEPIISGVAISSIGISPQNDNVRMVGLRNGKVYATTTGANPLTDVSSGSFPARFVARVVVDPNNVNTAYATFGGFGVAAGQHVWKTTNLNGAPPTWSGSASGIPDVPVNAFAVDPANSNNLFAGTDIGVYVSSDAGASWLPFGTGLPVVAVFDMAIHPVTRTLRIATHGRGMWEINGAPLPVQIASFTASRYNQWHVRLAWRTISEINNYGFEVQRGLERTGPFFSLDGSFTAGHGTTNEPHDYNYIDTTAQPRTWFYRLKQIDLDGSVHYTDAVEINTLTSVFVQSSPTELGLGQNYPNPFNPSTKIRYALPNATHVVLEMFNTLGEQVITLVNGKEEAGYHDIEFTNSSLPSGVYYYRLTAGNSITTRKMVLMK